MEPYEAAAFRRVLKQALAGLKKIGARTGLYETKWYDTI
jgi:hypothetical protein